MFFKKVFVLLMLVFFALTAAFLVIEIGLRFYQFLGENSHLGVKPYRTNLEWIEHPDIGKVFFAPNQQGWLVTPSGEYLSFLKINSIGLNDDEHRISKPKNTYRILFLGDSFVASVQTPREKTFFKQIEKNLNKIPSEKQVETIALGLGDTGTAQQYLALREIGIKYKPDLVVHMFLTANDLKNNSQALMQDPYKPYFILDNGKLKLLPHQQYSQRKMAKFRDLIKQLYFIEFLLSIRQNIQERNKNASLDYPVDYHTYDKKYSKEYLDSWTITQKLILESKKLTEKNSGKYILVTLANNEQVNKNLWDQLLRTYPKMQDRKLDLEKPDKLIFEFCFKEKLNCLSLLPDFKQYLEKNPTETTHYKIDGHWNQNGTNVAAKSLFIYLDGFLKKTTFQ